MSMFDCRWFYRLPLSLLVALSLSCGDTENTREPICPFGFASMNGQCVEVVDCGLHGQAHDDHCHCDTGFSEVDGRCVEDAVNCGPHGHSEGDHCDCHDGYTEVNGTCAEEDLDSCGPHGHAHGDQCLCDPGYTELQGACEANPDGDRPFFVEETFSYSPGLVDGRAGGQGFAGEWSGPGTIGTRSLRYYDEVGQRWTYFEGGALRPHGGAGAGGGGQASRRIDTHRLVLSDEPGLVGAPGESIWISFVAFAEDGQEDGQWGGLQLFGKGFRSMSDGGDHHDHRHGDEDPIWNEEVFFIGAPYAATGRPTHWGLDRYPLDAPAYSEIPVHEAALLVVRIDFAPSSEEQATVSLWVNPRDASNTPDVVLPGPDFRIQSLRLAGFEGFVVDELRMGEAYSDVVRYHDAADLAVHSAFGDEVRTVQGLDDGLGWMGPWDGNGNVVEWAACQDIYTSCSGYALEGNATREIDTRWVRPEFSDSPGRIGAPGAQIWIGFLAHLPGGQNEDLRFAGLQLFDGPTELRFLGAPYWEGERPQNWGLDQPGEPLPRYTETPTTNPVHYVAAVTFAAEGDENALIEVWIDPVSFVDLGAPQVSLQGPDFRFDRIRLRGGSGSLFTDIRIAETATELGGM